jgi:hypothetical protein
MIVGVMAASPQCSVEVPNAHRINIHTITPKTSAYARWINEHAMTNSISGVAKWRDALSERHRRQ